jgi:amylovoran biosynthesis glycosyltransferase AmsD
MKDIKTILLFVAQVNKPGGTERVVVNLANNFINRGYNVSIYSVNTFEGNSFYPLDNLVKLIHLGVVLEKNVFKRVTWGYLQTIKKIKNCLLKEPAILMATDPITCYTFALLKRRFPQHKFIACEHMGISIANKYSLLARKILYKNLDAVVTLTNRDKETLIERKINCKILQVIPNEISFFPSESCDYYRKTILTVGKLDNQKGYDLLLDYAIPILKSHPDWKLFIVGQGIWLDLLNKKIKDNSISNQIQIFAPTKDIIKYYLSSSIYVMSSRYEGFPMVLLEARACGLPVLSVDCPSGPADILHEDDGILVPMNSPELFRQELEKLINNPDLRRKLGVNARKDANNYNSDSIFQQWSTLFTRLAIKN